MNPEDLRYFLAVQQAGSIKGGARILKCEHSTVSRRLTSLEEALGARLFERTPEGLLETDVARAIAPLAQRIDSLTRELVDTASVASDAPKGPVRIAVSPITADHFLMSRMPELMQQYPDVAFEIVAAVDRVSLVKRDADIAIRQHPAGKAPAEPSALAIKVGTFGAAIYASQAYVARHGLPSRPVRSLAGHKWISMGPEAPGDLWNVQLDEPAEQVLSAFPYNTMAGAVIAGIGIAVLPCLSSDRDARLIRISDVVVRYDMWVVTNHDARNNPRVRAVKNTLVEIIRAASADLAGEC